MLAYFSRYTHRVAISNSRFLNLDGNNVTIRRRDNRARGQVPGASWIKSMTLPVEEFIRRFLTHVLSSGFHRIRHYGLFASQRHAANNVRLHEFIPQVEGSEKPRLSIDATTDQPQLIDRSEAPAPVKTCPCCAGRMRLIEIFAPGVTPRSVKADFEGFDTS
ncbi:MAG: transposase [Bradyrhizobium sp.]|nr:transposase [Bradyrhizobium sp.]